MNIAIESGRALNLGPDAAMFRSSAEEIIYQAALRGHRIFHYSLMDVNTNGSPGKALMSKIKLKPSQKECTNVYENMELGTQEDIPLDQMDVHILKGDDVVTNSPQLDVIRRAEDKCRFVVSVDTFLALRDKYELFERCPDISTPSSYLVSEVDAAMEAILSLPNTGYVVIKDRYGYGNGFQVHRVSIDDPKIREKIGERIKQYKEIIIQEFCPDVLNGEIIMRYVDGVPVLPFFKKFPAKGQWKSNWSLGGTEEAYYPTDIELENAQIVIGKFPDNMVAQIDMMPSGKFSESDAFPGSGKLLEHGKNIGCMVMDKLEDE